jgi:hypothetical protein
MLSREKFVEKAKVLADNYYEAYSTWVAKSELIEKYYVGGYTGGNCWDDTTPTYQYSDDSTPEFGVLDEFLLEVAPHISFLKYKEIEKLVEEDSYTEREYYGNSSDYVTFSIDLDKLYDSLKED